MEEGWNGDGSDGVGVAVDCPNRQSVPAIVLQLSIQVCVTDGCFMPNVVMFVVVPKEQVVLVVPVECRK